MARPCDYRDKPRHVKYAEAQHVGVCTAPAQPRLRYQTEVEPQTEAAGLITQLLDAIANTAEWKFLRKLMNESMPVGTGGGEVAAADPDPAAGNYMKQHAHYNRVSRHVDEHQLKYQRAEDAERARRERYEKRAAAHAELAGSFDALNESRKDVSQRIAAHALRQGLSYDQAAADLGLTRPDVPMPTASLYS